jgi:predicted dehydrogenase
LKALLTATKPVSIAQIGCGYWGPNLLRNLASHPGFRLAALVEKREARRAYVAAHYPGVQLYNDVSSILADPEISALVIATPAATHFELTEAAIKAGKHVLVEKPLATRVADADRLIELANRHGSVLMAGHTFLYHDAVHELRRMLLDDFLGQNFYMHSQRLNLGQLRSDVNVWWNLAPHDLSILCFLAGDRMPSTISASGTAFLQPGIEDVVTATLVWDDGLTAFVHVSWLDPNKVRRLTLVGSRRMVVYDDMSDYKITVLDKGFDHLPHIGDNMDFDDAPMVRFEQREGEIHKPYIRIREPLRNEIDHFCECIATGKEPRTGGRHARDIVALLEAGQESIKAGGRPIAPSLPA